MEAVANAAATTITKYVPCEVRSVIRFFIVRGETAAEINRQLVSVYGTNVMDISNVRRWVKQFKEGREDIFDEERSWRPSLVSKEVVEKVDNVIRKDRRLTLDEFHELIPDISRSVLYETITGKLAYRFGRGSWRGRDL